MKTQELRPIPERPEDYEAVEKEILRVLKEELYLPLLKSVQKNGSVLKNSLEDVVSAVATGRIQFTGGHFEGSFSASISKELKQLGASWDRTHGWWKIPQSKLPADIRAAIGASETKFIQASKRMQSKLEDIVPSELAAKLRLDSLIDKTIFRADEDLRKTMKNISVTPQLTPARKKTIAEQYTKNMDLYVTEFTEREIIKLRKMVQKSVFKGNRYEGLENMIRKSFQVSQAKAQFLARQETSLLVTTYKYDRYKDAGVEKYRWQTVGGTKDHPVREWHKKLNGKVFSFDDPPVDDEKGGTHNPGQAFNCRCIAVPIVRF